MPAPPPINPVIVFQPDGYRMDGQKVMGRQSAGNGFLRAAVKAAGTQPLYGYAPHKATAQSWAQTVTEINPHAKVGWAPPSRPDLIRKAGHLYVPGPALRDVASMRLRSAPDAWSITGVTHTLASHTAMDALADLVTAPLMPWDALICTSSAALTVAQGVIDAQNSYLAWRLGSPVAPAMPQLPVIPLGVHCADFDTRAGEREASRLALGLAQNEVVALYMGRLAFHAKAHPHAMYLGLQAAARNSGRKLVLIQCGQFPNATTADAFLTGAAACPDVRCIFVDGKDDKARRQCWAGADLFISLSDNIQETFGLTPVEAMAAGLPVVVTDWDGYKDTVRHGVDGFRVPTWLPSAGQGEQLAADHESGEDTYDMFCGLACLNLSVDQEMLAASLTLLATDDELRLRMGRAGRQRARERYDWAVIYRAYRALWHELDLLRRQPGKHMAAPQANPARPDPFAAFAHFPSNAIHAETSVTLVPGASVASFEANRWHPLFSHLPKGLPDVDFFAALHALLGQGAHTVGETSSLLGQDGATTTRWIAVCAKMGLIRLDAQARS